MRHPSETGISPKIEMEITYTRPSDLIGKVHSVLFQPPFSDDSARLVG